MSAARKAETGAQRSTIRERARSSRAAAQRVAGPQETEQHPALLSTCAVARVGRSFAEAADEHFALEDLLPHQASSDVRVRIMRLDELMTDLQEAISYGRAGSPGGMLAQLSVAYDALGLLKDGVTEQIKRDAEARATRCILSVAAALCAWTGTDRDDFGAKYLMPARIDRLAVLSTEIV